MGKLNAVASALGAAFVASAHATAQIEALGKSAAQSHKFRTLAAKIIAKDANTYYKLKGDKVIVAYETEYGGKAGVAFGVPKFGKNDKGETVILSYERTKQADAVRKWFSRNVTGKKAKKAAPKGGVWAQIADAMHEINALKKKLSAENRKALKAALAKVAGDFAKKVEA